MLEVTSIQKKKPHTSYMTSSSGRRPAVGELFHVLVKMCSGRSMVQTRLRLSDLGLQRGRHRQLLLLPPLPRSRAAGATATAAEPGAPPRCISMRTGEDDRPTISLYSRIILCNSRSLRIYSIKIKIIH